MKNKMLKKLILIFIVFVRCISCEKIYGISEDFKFVIDTIGIPRYNVYGKEINEEIYKAYNVFSYSWPEELGNDVGQRWKNSKYGLWAQWIGAYTGIGIRGEYNLLGRDYSGNIINNYYFPVDALPSNTPEYWNYYFNPGAADSWKDKSKYKYVEQLDYMKNTKLLFNDISSKDNSDNPEKIKEYNITALKIGLDKARLDVCSTWKTNGIIHTRKKIGNNIWYSVFLTNPMAANANVQSNIKSIEKFWVMKSNQDNIILNIEYGANIVNMTGYAKKEHVKQIVSKLYINGKVVDEISGSKTDTVGKKYVLKLTRNDLVENENNIINIVNDCYAHTEFAVDGLMRNSAHQSVSIFVQKKEIIPLKLNNIKILEKKDNILVVRPLAQFNSTNTKESFGITEAGKYAVIKLDINDEITYDELTDMKLYFNDEEIKDIDINKIEENNKLYIIFRIPTYTESSIFGWKSLREMYGNYFSINESEVGKRIKEPHKINITVNFENKKHDVNLYVDTIDDYITNINYKYNGGNNQDRLTLNLEEWLKE